QMVAVAELTHSGRRAGGDQITWTKREATREKSNMLAQPADHVARVRGHRLFAVLQNFDRKILRLVDLVSRHDPWTQRAESIEAFANITCVVHALAPGIALADIPADRVTENVIERLGFVHLARPLADDGAKLALEIEQFGNLSQDNRNARGDDRRGRLQKKLRHQVIFVD